ncbi:MAG: transposase, partial [Deltaproteobacteria bacterium]|nr:transposase [Deltaproteobacteria bacterium]
MKTPSSIHVLTTKREHKGKAYRCHLLRRTYREGGKVKAETLSNLTALGDDLVELIREALRG